MEQSYNVVLTYSQSATVLFYVRMEKKTNTEHTAVKCHISSFLGIWNTENSGGQI